MHPPVRSQVLTFLKEIKFVLGETCVAMGSGTHECAARTRDQVPVGGPLTSDNPRVCLCPDTGYLHMWDKASGSPVAMLKADTSVVNSIAGHKTLPIIFTAGINRTIKMWSPDGPRAAVSGPGGANLAIPSDLNTMHGVEDVYDERHGGGAQRPAHRGAVRVGVRGDDEEEEPGTREWSTDSDESEEETFWRLIEGEQGVGHEGVDEGDEIEIGDDDDDDDIDHASE